MRVCVSPQERGEQSGGPQARDSALLTGACEGKNCVSFVSAWRSQPHADPVYTSTAESNQTKIVR